LKLNERYLLNRQPGSNMLQFWLPSYKRVLPGVSHARLFLTLGVTAFRPFQKRSTVFISVGFEDFLTQ
jgi:hypothetical protein